MTGKILAATAVLAGAVGIYLATGSVPNQPAAFDSQGGAVVTTCWTVNVDVPCDTGRFPPAICPANSIDDEMVTVVLRAPTNPSLVPSALIGLADRVAPLVDTMKETPGTCPTNGKVLQVIGLADDGPTCVHGDVTGGGAGRRVGKCCGPTCACAGAFCVQVPAVEFAGHEVGDHRVCRLVRASGSPPPAAVAYCDSKGL
jgi:hypothetical protein